MCKCSTLKMEMTSNERIHLHLAHLIKIQLFSNSDILNDIKSEYILNMAACEFHTALYN